MGEGDVPLDLPGIHITEELPPGPFQQVLLVRDDNLGGRPIVIKVLAPTTETELHRRFEHDYRRLTAMTSHPHVVSVLGFGTTGDGLAFIKHELVSEDTLERRLLDRRNDPSKPPPVTWEAAVELGARPRRWAAGSA